MSRAFITGSQAYGKPREDSDIDLVMLVEPHVKALLTSLSETKKEPVRFGKLNLLLLTDEAEFAAWKIATMLCYREQGKQGGPLSRDKAVATIDNLFEQLGMRGDGVSGG